jgi:D-arginine dehydrogenase
LRTFAPDRAMVIGPDPAQANFVWCVGQGGTGIQTSPATGRLVADLVITGRESAHFDGTGLDTATLSPARFR